MMTLKKADAGRNLLFNSGPWILAAACVLLLGLLSLFSFSSYQREKELILEGLAQKGLTLMRFVNSSVRVSMIDNLRSLQSLTPWESHMLAAMEQAVEQPGVEYILLADHSGNIISAAGVKSPGPSVDQKTMALVNELSRNSDRSFVITMKKSGQSDKKVFQVASRYLPPEIGGRGRSLKEPPPHMRRMMRNLTHHPNFSKVQAELARIERMKAVYVVQLDFEKFNSPLRRQVLQIVILLAALVLVGIGGTLSFTTLKGLKGSQQRLGKIRAFNDILVSALPIGLIATDSRGIIQVVNEAAAALLGVVPKEIVGRSVAEGVPEELQGLFQGSEAGVGKDRHVELELSLNSEVRSTLQLAYMVVPGETGEFAGEVLLIRDLTEVRALEKELQTKERLAALGKMAAGVAHELRNPLSSIKGLAVLLKGKFSPESNEADTADVLVKEVERLNRSIGEMLDYARPEQLSRQPTSIEKLIQKTLSLVVIDAKSYGIKVRLENQNSLPEVLVDRDKLQQVFLNLFLNGIQAMESGGELLVKTKRSNQDVVIIVEDSGIGITSDNIDRVFDPYFTTKNDGTGLGLALTSKIIEEHQGKIEISSDPGVYTQVKITLPICDSTV
ncbi:MAG: two-component system sensor histidine kinase NtrB [Desulforhopalus sp.]